MQTQETQALLSATTPLCMFPFDKNLGRGSWYHGRHGLRQYWVYTPFNYQVGTVVPLIMILHGCLQSLFTHPCFIASATHMNQLADTQQFLVVYPHAWTFLDPSPISCWNFFLAANQYRDSGEPESLAGIVQDMLQDTSRWTIDRQRIYVAGISSGGCATANLGATYPDLFAAIGVHSGGEYGIRLPIPLGEAAQAPGAVVQAPGAVVHLPEARVLSGEVEERVLAVIPPGPDPIQQGKKAFDAMGRFARVVPTIVFHGTDDHVSNPENGNQVTQQWLYTNQLASHGTFKADFKDPSSTTTSPAGPHEERSYTVDTWRDDQGRDVVTYYRVEGMNHRWSGGTPGVPFTDPSGPDASQAFYEFFMAHPKPTGALMPVSTRPEEIVSVTTTQVTPTSLTVVKSTPGRLCKVLVTTANGENAINIFDNASAASGTIIGVVAANASVGTVYDLQMPAANGITIAGTASAGTITVSYS